MHCCFNCCSAQVSQAVLSLLIPLLCLNRNVFVFESCIFRNIICDVVTKVFFVIPALGFSHRFLQRGTEASQKTGMLCSNSHGTCVLCSSAMEIAGISQQHDHSSTIGHEDGEELCSVPAGSRGCSVAALWNIGSIVIRRRW